MSSPRGRHGYVRQAALEEAEGFSDAMVLHARAGALACPLDCKVLVLNKLYVAVRVISARRAFSLLCREIAEVIHVENGRFITYTFETWAELAELHTRQPAELAWTTESHAEHPSDLRPFRPAA